MYPSYTVGKPDLTTPWQLINLWLHPAITWQIINLQVDPAITWQLINLRVNPAIMWHLINLRVILAITWHLINLRVNLAITWHLINLRVNLTITWRRIKSFPYSHVLSQQYRIRVIPQNLKIHFFFKTIVFSRWFKTSIHVPKIFKYQRLIHELSTTSKQLKC